MVMLAAPSVVMGPAMFDQESNAAGGEARAWSSKVFSSMLKCVAKCVPPWTSQSAKVNKLDQSPQTSKRFF
jgi:hypothetical protein